MSQEYEYAVVVESGNGKNLKVLADGLSGRRACHAWIREHASQCVRAGGQLRIAQLSDVEVRVEQAPRIVVRGGGAKALEGDTQ